MTFEARLFVLLVPGPFLKPLIGVISVVTWLLLGLFKFFYCEERDEIRSEFVELLWRLGTAPSNLLTDMRVLELA